ncbi:hypothetical protein JOC95_002625 [Bacillus tianshenii]|uniref:DUF1878 domain-containing protein n=1 Tax=Sutcliffiella tianshenii TaxID=1463404 RepID=A0ABS2P1C8_9BACI|nr:DUF1878 family protein [Bacillus tianshenii]MBM7620770.1 hypothetical protein [Bacillus tianshenii]
MSSMEERLAKLEYHMELLLKQINMDRFPFDALVVQHNIGREDVRQLMSICERLSIEMEKQKAEGFVTFAPLLTEFHHKLHHELPLEKTIHAMKSQGMYESLMDAFLKLLIKKK